MRTLCDLVEAYVIDLDRVHKSCRQNDPLLLGMKGSISEFELGVVRARMLDAAQAKARRGELRINAPTRYILHREDRTGLQSGPAARCAPRSSAATPASAMTMADRLNSRRLRSSRGPDGLGGVRTEPESSWPRDINM